MRRLERKLAQLEDAGEREEARRAREALTYLSDEDLHALEEELLRPTLSPGEPLPPNPFLEKMKRWEAEAKEQQHINRLAKEGD